MAPELKFNLQDTVDWRRKWLVDFNAGKTQFVLFGWYNKTGAIDLKMYGSFLEKKSYFKMLGLPSYSKLDWSSNIISVAKTASKKIEALFHFLQFLSPEIALYLIVLHRILLCRSWCF